MLSKKFKKPTVSFLPFVPFERGGFIEPAHFKDILEAKVENLNNFVKTEFQKLEEKILILSTRPCSC